MSCKLLLSVVFLLSLVFPVFSFEPSGGVLMLDGEDDYAILPLAEHGYIFPRDTDAFTAEVWFYPKSRPEQGEKGVILSQQVAFGLTADDCRGRVGKKDQVCSYGLAYLEGAAANGVRGIDAVIKTDQWNYLAVIFKDSTIYLAYNNQILRGAKRDFMNVVAAEIFFLEGFKDFFIGGYAEDKLIVNRDGRVLARETYFHGAIDAIRFSNIARYDLPAERGPSPFEPPPHFFIDAHTLAFWDFNDEEGADHFQDESGNGKTLIGMNGAITLGGTGVNLERAPEDGLEIRPDTSLATTWGQVKSESF
ncbi:MAG: hypothetical protein OXH00_23250 [Candidatus Poribacteria bacterium]|nr:hypothetical protein [Candidatus Poribacteria bacterium]